LVTQSDSLVILSVAILVQGKAITDTCAHIAFRVSVLISMARHPSARMGKSVVVKHGHAIAYCPDAESAAHLMMSLGGSSKYHNTDTNFALDVAQAAQSVLNEINGAFSLVGRARKSLGTALRASSVRRTLDVGLMKDLTYVAAGADAFRHLSATDMGKTAEQLRNAVAAASAHGVIQGCSSDTADDGASS
jgi:hypothetical protein